MDPKLPRPATTPAPASPASDDQAGRWAVPDLIDFDYYVDADERRLREDSAERKRLAERDRRLYRERIAENLDDLPEHTPAHRSRALRLWLGARRSQEDPALQSLLPGSAFARGQRLVTVGLGLIGLFAGFGVASALLQYDGRTPVNVSWYLFWLVFIQLLLAGVTLLAWSARRSRAVRGAMEDVSLLGHLFRPLFTRAMRWVQRQRLATAPLEVQERARARVGLLEGHYALYGPTSYLPMLIPAQVFGIAFNVGVIITTVALQWFTDLAFGWGSALDARPDFVHGLVQAIALPWGWLLGEGVGLPTLEQVAGSRISLKDPLFLQAASDLRSWRTFLVLAVITYGLLPRIVLLVLSQLTARRALDRLPFTHQRTQALYARLVTPSLETAASSSGDGPPMPIPAPLRPLTAQRSASPMAGVGWRPADAVVPALTPPPTAVPPSDPAPVQAPTQPRPSLPAAARSETQPEAAAGSKPRSASATEPTVLHPTPAPVPRPEPDLEPDPAPAHEPAHEPEAEPESPTKAGPRVAADACVLLLHVDIADVLEEADHGRLQQLLRRHSGWQVAASAVYGGGTAMAEQALGLIAQARWDAPPARVAVIQDGSQPPITEGLRFLRAVRQAAGEQAQVLLALIGDPDGDDPLPPLSAFELGDWQRKLEQMGDPYLRLEMLATADDEDQ